MLALDTHEHGILSGGVMDLMVAGKGSGDDAVRRRATATTDTTNYDELG